MESLPPVVDNAYKLCCPMKSKTLSNKDLRNIKYKYKKIQHYFVLYC